jgi:glycosyltransferase involved in cell wall biosynthesis
MKKVLVLYSEIAGYFVACVRRYLELHGGEVHVVRWPVHPTAPFKFATVPGLHYHDREGKTVADMIALGASIQPDIIYVTGWIDKAYLKVAQHFRRKGVPVIAAFDTQWRGDWRQRLAVAISPFYFRRIFTHAWVPGMFQYEYARRLGFPREKILTGMYAADTAIFEAVYPAAMAKKAEAYPRVLLYVGRYEDFKGVSDLYTAFRNLSDREDHGWQLLLVGSGSLAPELIPTANIRLQDFLQPEELPALAMETGAFILPSRRDAWGVVIHEFAAAGMPILSTDAAGAITSLVKRGYNGDLHLRGDIASIEAMLRRFMALGPAAWIAMGHRSHALSKQISPDTWAATLHTLLTDD